jgi:hypothetical protein
MTVPLPSCAIATTANAKARKDAANVLKIKTFISMLL